MKITLRCLNTATDVEVQGGETLAQVLERGAIRLSFSPICARVNNKTESLHYPIFSPKTVEFISAYHPSGSRVRARSLCMMLYKAVTECMPGVRLKIVHSISRGYYCKLVESGRSGSSAEIEVNGQMLERLSASMRQLIKSDIPFLRHERPTREVIEIFKRQGLPDKVLLLETLHELYTVFYTLGDLADSYNSCLAPSTGCLEVFSLALYKKGFLLLGPDPVNSHKALTPSSQEKMYAAFKDYLDFNHIIGITNAGELNRALDKHREDMIVNVSEALHEKSIAKISDSITERYRRGEARIVLISGPSSSGKTTFTKRLAIQLMTNLIKPQMISLDNYFINRDLTPRDETGDFDFESLYALDIAQFNSDLNNLLAGREVELPYYNFEAGQREYHGDKIRLDEGSVLLIEGIHGLNPELTASVPEKMKYRVYVSALTTIAIDDHNWIPTTDNRLLRRIVRDLKYRGTSPRDTIRRWPSVRRGEEKWIFPFQENADSMFNSSLLFEISVMKEQAERALKTIPQDADEYCEAYRLRRFLSYFQPASETPIPHTSLLREFLGGSTFHY